MSRDYKTAPSRKPAPSRGGGSLLTGILIGLLLGLGIALGVAWYLNRTQSPFVSRPKPEQASPAKGETTKADAAKQAPAAEPKVDAKETEPRKRFEFYDILKGTDEQSGDKGATKADPSSAPSREAFFLQAGAFQSAPDADNLKAKLALEFGVQALIQTTTIPDKGVWHRVRIGPYSSVEELTRVRDRLREGGIDTTLIKVRETGGQ